MKIRGQQGNYTDSGYSYAYQVKLRIRTINISVVEIPLSG